MSYFDKTMEVGASDFNLEMGIPDIEELKDSIKELQEWALPVNMIVQCEHCGTFAIRGFLCTQCGAPINLTQETFK